MVGTPPPIVTAPAAIEGIDHETTRPPQAFVSPQSGVLRGRPARPDTTAVVAIFVAPGPYSDVRQIGTGWNNFSDLV